MFLGTSSHVAAKRSGGVHRTVTKSRLIRLMLVLIVCAVVALGLTLHIVVPKKYLRSVHHSIPLSTVSGGASTHVAHGIHAQQDAINNSTFRDTASQLPQWSEATTVNAPIAQQQHWSAASIYMPIPPAARRSFLAHQSRQLLLHAENQALLQEATNSWSYATWRQCFDAVPECVFFHDVGGEMTLLAAKCCVEHRKLRATLFYIADVAAAHNLSVFLMFGTLLSSMRDGGGSLLPWETDIDLGILGAHPDAFATAFVRGGNGTDTRHHYAEVCKTDGNDADPARRGTCSDVHAVYYAATKTDVLAGERTRVELWPYRSAPRLTKDGLQRRNEKQLGAKHRRLTELYGCLVASEPDVDFVDALETVRRGELVLPRAMVLPLSLGVEERNFCGSNHSTTKHPAPQLRQCRLWGRPFLCPRYALTFLDLEYHGRDVWMRPKTIHWGSENAGGW